jgi:hypothetical protein
LVAVHNGFNSSFCCGWQPSAAAAAVDDAVVAAGASIGGCGGKLGEAKALVERVPVGAHGGGGWRLKRGVAEGRKCGDNRRTRRASQSCCSSRIDLSSPHSHHHTRPASRKYLHNSTGTLVDVCTRYTCTLAQLALFHFPFLTHTGTLMMPSSGVHKPHLWLGTTGCLGSSRSLLGPLGGPLGIYQAREESTSKAYPYWQILGLA